MSNRHEIERELKEKLAEGEAGLKKLKAKLEAEGYEASDEVKAAVGKAELALERGRIKAEQLKNATDDEFDKLWAETKSDWHELKANMSDSWAKVTHSVRDFFT